MPANGARIEREREYHNARFGEAADVRASLGKWYAALAKANAAQDETVRRLSRGSVVLEYGCADGALSLSTLELHRTAKKLVGIDISDKAIEKAQRLARDAGANNCEFHAMNAERMSFDDSSFDLVFGRGIVHHLDLRRCFSEIARVLKPGGHAIFLEPLGHNPLINAFRTRTPHMRTPDEHPIVTKDLALAAGYFEDVKAAYYGLATLGAVLVRDAPFGATVMRLCQRIDDWLLRSRAVQHNAWMVLLSMRKEGSRTLDA